MRTSVGSPVLPAICHGLRGPNGVGPPAVPRETRDAGPSRGWRPLVLKPLRGAYGNVMVVPSPLAVTEKVPVLLDVYV
jgi:hypothetical protein